MSGVGTYLTFRLASDEYAVDIARVREVIDYEPPTRVSSGAPAVLGIINLRGTLVPIVDLKRKFGMPESEATRRRCIVVVETDLDGEATWLGLVADGASQVLEVPAGGLTPAPGFGAPVRPELLRGMVQSGKKFILVLDLGRLLTLPELQAAAAARAPAPPTRS